MPGSYIIFMKKIKATIEINNKIIALYLSGKGTYQIATDCGCSQTFIMNVLKRYNIPRRTAQSYTTKYITNENFFNNVNTEEKAYILGFLYADGNNYVKPGRHYEISIKLQEKDRIILEKIRDYLSPKSPIKIVGDSRTDNLYPLLKINSKILTQQLTKLGCIPNKSLILTWPEWLIDPKLQQHFIRGYFDGDGSIYSKKPTKTGYVNYAWAITSSNNFCNEVKNIIENHMQIHCSQSICKPKSNKITTSLSVGGNLQVMKILDWMYQDATIYMPRKYHKYLEFKNYVSSLKLIY